MQPGAGAGKHACLDLRRLCLVLEKYREMDKASGFAGLHKKGQAEVRWGGARTGATAAAGTTWSSCPPLCCAHWW